MWLLTLALSAAAPEPMAEAVAVVRADDALGGGVSAGLAAPLSERLAAEGWLDLGGTRAGPLLAARLGARAWLDDPEDGALGLVLAAVARWDDRGLQPQGYAGVAVRGPARSRWALRADAGVDVGAQGIDAFRLGIGLTRGPRPAPPPAAPDPPPAAPEPEPEGLSVRPPDALVWIPHPVCAWATAAEAGPLLARHADLGLVAQVRAPGHRPVALAPGQTAVELAPAPPQGAVVVVGWPGDEVLIDGRVVPTGTDGVAVLTAPLGPLSLEVRGGGRRAPLRAYAGEGRALWMRAPAPPTVEVRFPADSAALSPADRAALAVFAADLGGARLRLVGGASPEGDRAHNEALAAARAQAVREALIAAGVPEARVLSVRADVAVEPGDAEAQRRVLVEVVDAEVPR